MKYLQPILLVTPPSVFLTDDKVFVNLGILRVAAVLLQQGIEVIHCDLCGVSNYFYKLKDYLRKYNPKVIGITATTPQMPNVNHIVNMIKRYYPNIRVILGGPHVTLTVAAVKYEKLIKKEYRAHKTLEKLIDIVDVLVSGDGEKAIWEAISENPRNIIDSDDLMNNLFMSDKFYDNTPLPARNLVDLGSYHYEIDGYNSTSLISQLGCPFECFEGNTKIIVSNGPNKLAKKIDVGDKLVAIDENSMQLVETEVIYKLIYSVNEILFIKFTDGSFVKCTKSHPFYINNGWTRANNLKIGDEIYHITFKDKISFNKILYNPVKREEVRKKISISVKKHVDNGVYNYDFLKTKERKEWLKKNTLFIRDEVREKNKKRMLDNNPMKNPIIVAKCLNTRKTNNKIINYKFTEKGRINRINQMKLRNPMFNKKIAKRAGKTYSTRLKLGKINGPIQQRVSKEELRLKKLLDDNFPNKFKSIGNGSFRIDGLSPDFICYEDKKIIEYYGCYWHKCPRCYPKGNRFGVYNEVEEYQRINIFNKRGYKVFIVWACEFKNKLDELSLRLNKFILNGKKIQSIEIIKEITKVYNYHCEPYNNYFANYLLSHNCNFCGGRRSRSLRVTRSRSIDSIITEIRHLYEIYRYRGFMFYDDELNVNKEFEGLLYALDGLQEELGVDFKFRGFLKSELFNEKQAELMKKVGFSWILCGFESGSEKILKNINKKATLYDNNRVIENCDRYGLKVKALMSIGHAGESEETVIDTFNWLIRVKPHDFDLTIITPYPGSPYYDESIPYDLDNNIWVYEYNNDKLYMQDVNYLETSDYYKGVPGIGYKSYVYTDYISSKQLVNFRDKIDDNCRKILNISQPYLNTAIDYEHSMGMK